MCPWLWVYSECRYGWIALSSDGTGTHDQLIGTSEEVGEHKLLSQDKGATDPEHEIR